MKVEKVKSCYRFFAVRSDTLLHLLSIAECTNQYISFPSIPNLPKNCEYQAVTVDFVTDSIIFKVYHPSFPEIEPGVMPQIEYLDFRSKVIQLPPGTKISQ